MNASGTIPWENRRRLGAPLGFVAWMLAGCSVLGSVGPGEGLFQDDFSRASTGWDRYDDPGVHAGYLDGAYQIRIESPNSLAWGTPRFDPGDVPLEVDAYAG